MLRVEMIKKRRKSVECSGNTKQFGVLQTFTLHFCFSVILQLFASAILQLFAFYIFKPSGMFFRHASLNFGRRPRFF